ncbi:MAG: sulfotransferase family 2 domain-containing protein [Pseudomonadota bacterium]
MANELRGGGAVLIFHNPAVVIFTIPRTGSTTLHMALNRRATQSISYPPAAKHMSVRDFEQSLLPDLLAEGINPRRVVVLREPLQRLRSWYTYRKRRNLKDATVSTRDMTFEDFVLASLEETPPPAAQIGSQYKFVCNRAGELGVDHLFCMERPKLFHRFLRRHLGVAPKTHRYNAAPATRDADDGLTRKTRHALYAAREEEFALYKAVQATGQLNRRQVYPDAATSTPTAE